MEPNGFLPVNREEMLERGWDAPDFVYVSGGRLRRSSVIRSGDNLKGA